MGVGEAGKEGERERCERRDGRGVLGVVTASREGAGRIGVKVSGEAG